MNDKELALMKKLGEAAEAFKALPRMSYGADIDARIFMTSITQALNVVASRTARREMDGDDP